MKIIKALNLSKIYFHGVHEIWALRGVNLEVEQGEILCIWGKSGSGKSTLLNILGCLDRPSLGKVYLEEEDITLLSSLERSYIRREKIGFVFQQYNLISNLTAQENVALPLKYAKISYKRRMKMAEELLEMVDLKDRLNFYWAQLSGGEAQRVAFARALINSPKLVLADEPTGEIDTENAKKLIELIKNLNQKLKQTFLIVTHDPLIAQIATRTLILKDGQIASLPA